MSSNISNNIDMTENSELITETVETQQSNVQAEGYVDNLRPCVGMTFESDDKAYEFYNLYARSIGFSIRKHFFYKAGGKRKFSSRMIVCSKQGQKVINLDIGSSVKRRRETRSGCGAHIFVKERNDGNWAITRFEEDHNHPLATPSKVLRMRSHFVLSDTSKDVINKFHDAGVGPSTIARVLNYSGEPTITIQYCKNHLKATKKNNIGKECLGVISYFKSKKRTDEGFFFRIEKDETNTTRNVFWTDSRSRDRYLIFGDVIVFDTTYRTNKFCMPFAPFTGINHHRQSMLFGCALLADETEETFIWLFQTWLECMSGKHPICIITDQDIAMGNAIRKIFPTRHRFCIWHIKKNAMTNTKNLCARGNFLKDFNDWVYMSSIEKFENRWAELKENYGIVDGHWVETMFMKCHYWVPIYFSDIFCAGMSSSQRAESINAFFDGYVNSNTSLTDFVFQYDEALRSRRAAEEREDYKNLHSSASLTSKNLLEIHAGEIYTQNVFCIFQTEFKQIADYFAKKISKTDQHVVYSVNLMGKEDEMKNIVEYSNGEIISVKCSCRKFEQQGIFCVHVLNDLNKKGIASLPEQYILHRWTMNARYAKAHVVGDNGSTSSGQRSITPLQKMRWRANLLKVNDFALRSPEFLDFGAKHILEVIQKIENFKMTHQIDSRDVASTSVIPSQNSDYSDDAINDPVYAKAKGRPRKMTRIKSSIEISLSNVDRKKRICGECGMKGHYRTTCVQKKGTRNKKNEAGDDEEVEDDN